MRDDPNRPETEEDGIRAGALRREKARRAAAGRSTTTFPDLGPAPENSLENAENYLAWAAAHGLRGQVDQN